MEAGTIGESLSGHTPQASDGPAVPNGPSLSDAALPSSSVSAELYIDRDLAPYAGAVQAAAFLVGGYAGWPNFGDYLQLRSTLAMHERIGAHQTLFLMLDARARSLFRDSGIGRGTGAMRVVPVYYVRMEESVADELVRLPHLPSRVLVHLYGGGFINDWWGELSRRAIGALIERHARENAGGRLCLFMSGLQVSPSREADAWRPLFERAEYIGVRDHQTATFLGRQFEGIEERIHYSGDDALLALAAGCGSVAGKAGTSTVAAHINLAYYSVSDSDLRLSRVAQVLAAAARHFGSDTTCDLLVAFRDDYIKEQEAAEQLKARYNHLATEQMVPSLRFRHRNIFQEAVSSPFQLGASFLVTCSYHVALSGLLSHCPTLLLVENDYYRQKASGLAEAFGAQRFAVLEPKDCQEQLVTALLDAPSDANTASAMWIGQLEKADYLSRLCLDMEREIHANSSTSSLNMLRNSEEAAPTADNGFRL